MTTAASSGAAPADRRTVRVMCAVYFGFGMPIAMLGVAWPSIRDELDRPNGALGVLATAYGLGRLALSGSGGLQLRRRSFGAAASGAVGMLGVASLAVGLASSWPLLLLAIAVVGLASGAIDALGGRFISSVGAVTTAGLLAGSYGVGATVGPAVVALGDQWRWSYAGAALVALAAAVAVRSSSLRWPDGMRDDPAPAAAPDTRRVARTLTLRSPSVVVSLLLMVCFIGIEVTVGNWTASFLEDERGVDGWIAGLAVSGFWAGATVGRLALRLVELGSRHLLRLTMFVTVGVASLALLPGVFVIAGAFGLGLSLAPFFPILMATANERVGPRSAPRLSGWQLIAGNVGGTGLPALTGVIVALTDERSILWVLLIVCGAGAATVLAERSLRT